MGGGRREERDKKEKEEGCQEKLKMGKSHMERNSGVIGVDK